MGEHRHYLINALITVKMRIICAVLVFLFAAVHTKVIDKKGESYLPIVLWHGMGDSCCFPFSMGRIMNQLNTSLPGVYITSLKMGSNVIDDVMNSYFMHPDKQVSTACETIRNDPNLKDGFNAIGFSQGGQFLRALVQRCEGIQMKNLISIGGQHQGVYGLPQCGSLNHTMCDYLRKMLTYAAYNEYVQEVLVQATYWHDPIHEEEYKEKSSFLADINNERTVNRNYIDNLDTLENFVMIKFTKDSMVQPTESEWFGYYSPGQSVEVQSLQQTDIYQDERLGLRAMDENGKLKFLSVDGDHLRFDWDWFEENVVFQYLN